ncbi:hypothetical protein NEF87_000475 [Candidatus Lokiarchaeum ossiferum]|uniref:Smr domain-containing protein n=1 Tax=Candidatus Lokiarchaeum ossiferum TaxID=2951803 RepID=A0ABY6HL00_9ARCH|nr:hypothetical protein NEF87_000475 [Candidatus Lokiarchaeum sp. B-35]
MARLDLHNCTLEDAKMEIFSFLQHTLVTRDPTVEIIHGHIHDT